MRQMENNWTRISDDNDENNKNSLVEPNESIWIPIYWNDFRQILSSWLLAIHANEVGMEMQMA